MSDETPQADGEPTEAAPTPANMPPAEASSEAAPAEPAPAPAPEAPAPAPAPEVPAEAPTVAAAPAAEPVTMQQPTKVDEDDVVPPPAGASHDRPGIFVPKWVGLVAAAIVAALVFGGIGYAIGQSNDNSSTQAASSNTPNFPGAGNGRIPNLGGGSSSGNSNGNSNGNGNSNSNGNSNGSSQTPTNPFGGNGNSSGGSSGGTTTTGNGGFLGVAIENADNGAQVTTVQTGSAAATAGLKTGDVITAVDGTTVDSASALAGIVQQHSSGDTITVTYTRNGQSATAKVTLGSRSSTGTPS
jgi:membrane-associated protease RseP (regulator of RpoE activity)